MKQRGILVAAVLSSALVSGGWLMERGARSAPRDAAAQARLFDEVFLHLRRDYVDTLADSALYRRAIAGVLDELHDPHSVFLDPKRLDRLDESTSGHYAGVGIQMGVRDSGITVIGTLPGTPAERAGIMPGDRIVEIEGRGTLGLTSDEALKSLRGAPGSTVHVAVERPGLAAKLPFTLIRSVIEVNPVQHALLLPGSTTGYVDLTVFSAAAASDLSRAIDSLRTAGARSLVLDLRGNPGGLLDQGVGVADLFLDTGKSIVATRGRTPRDNESIADRGPQRYGDMPLVVLTDSGTASASEIVAGALQDHDRALVVGTATYGKGSAQQIFRLGDAGAVKLTTALWYTPSGRSINRPHPRAVDEGADAASPADTGKARPKFHTDAGRTVLGGGGIVPDVEVAMRAPAPADLALQTALGVKVPQFRDALVEYALSLKVAHAIASPEFVVTPAMRDELFRRLATQHITVSREVYDAASGLVTRALSTQVTRYVFGPRAEFARTLRDDATLTKATELLQGATTPKELLSHVKGR
jgi:carboxyl-terminal processing protease